MKPVFPQFSRLARPRSTPPIRLIRTISAVHMANQSSQFGNWPADKVRKTFFEYFARSNGVGHSVVGFRPTGRFSHR
ncbi:hypothetical protein PTTG_27475 [Puccinia triticina 1-1 BBBD Race 1]|uniref:Uncharacterized protein n=2 Tax=Puccinia triticina TaxID=208348 RepID=A0A180GJT0_PUCT1|nr:uncharacterized protein PtA15_6A688 [Puccinia triticina]OAV92910.1 hypothetical protein PTTG_27475 [Puccinia triticina 1-1 BBBD Race 1]WAQ86058.1 hypothetical protein PtA15_6A688 [Puccinia triticina]WAR55951.1 hypothetical protein PtB15_6B695 [Puccinia triticina]